MNELRYSLCPNCDACPEVVVADGAVVIGEEDNQVRLSGEEWNVLVAGIRSGTLRAIGEEATAEQVCSCGCDCCA